MWIVDTKAVSLFSEAFFGMVLNRFTDSCSKRGVDKWTQKVYHPQFMQLELHHNYRGLDYLAEFKETLEEGIFANVKNIFNLKLDLVIWDTTTTYFEGSGPQLAKKATPKITEQTANR